MRVQQFINQLKIDILAALDVELVNIKLNEFIPEVRVGLVLLAVVFGGRQGHVVQLIQLIEIDVFREQTLFQILQTVNKVVLRLVRVLPFHLQLLTLFNF